MNKSKLIGLVLLGVIIAISLFIKKSIEPTKKVFLKGYVGGEKMSFLENEEVKKILKNRYGITLDYSKAGSIEMVKGDISQDVDFLWPSSQVALELYKLEYPNRHIKDEIIFNSPIVLYSWDIICDAFIKIGIVKKDENAVHYVVDFQKLINLVLSDNKWKDVGLDQLFGKVMILSTDPTKSNSGNMYCGLLANMIHGDVVTLDSLEQVLPQVINAFKKQGYMEHSSSDLFEQYLKMGVGAKPIIAGYESQIVEFSLQFPKLWEKLKAKARIMYPVPTVWSSHPVIVLTDNAKQLISALKDPDIQKIAWEKHGFRTGMVGIQNDPKVLKVSGIPESINQVIPMPGAKVMEKIIETLKS